MGNALRLTPEQAARLAKRRGLDPIPIVGTANASDRKFSDDIPVFTEAAATAKWLETVAPKQAAALAEHYRSIPTLTDAVTGPGAKPKRVRVSKQTSPYFQRLCALLRPHGIPDPTPEFKFSEDRRWRADFCWQKPVALMLEIDGGLFVNGGHNRGAALLAQMEKQNAAVLMGYRILRYSPDQLHEAARDVRAVFNR